MSKKIRMLLLIAGMALVCLCPVWAAALEAVEITDVYVHSDGKVTVEWDNPNGGAVTVGSLVMANDDAGNRILIETDIYGSSYTYDYLAPGMDYIVLVMPGTELDYAGMDIVSVPELPEFDDFRFSVTDVNLTYFVQTKNNYSYNYAHDLSPREIYDLLDEKQFWVRINFSHKVFSDTRTVPILTVVTSPTGYVVTDYDNVEIERNTKGFWRTMVHMNDALATMHDVNGGIPRGEYQVKVYVDGGYAGGRSFTID